MENAKVWLPILGIFLAVGGMFAFRHLDLVDKANSNLLTVRAALESTRDHLQSRKASFDQVRAKTEAAALKARDAQTRLTAAEQALEAANKMERTVEGELKYLANSMPATIEKAKASAPGTVLGDVTLGDGKTLRSATIRKLDDTTMSFVHSEGFSTVAHADLPTNLIEQYDLGASSLVAELKSLLEKSRLAPGEKAPEPKVVVPEPVSAPSSTLAVVDEEKVKSVRLKIVGVEARIKAALSSAEAYNRSSSDNYTNGDIAKSRGTPANKYWTAAQQAAQQAQVFKLQAQGLEAEKKKLEVELEFLLRGGR